MENVTRFVSLVDYLHDFDQIYRKAPIRGRSHMETDSEHSYKLAITCWYFVEKYNLKLDLLRVLKYALAHDLVEIQAGDTDAHNASEEQRNSKHTREQAALTNIKTRWSDFKDLYITIEQYEEKINAEAEFVYIMDKIQPVINTLLASNSYYLDSKVTYEDYVSWLDGKLIGLSKLPTEVYAFLGELKAFLHTKEKGFFFEAKE